MNFKDPAWLSPSFEPFETEVLGLLIDGKTLTYWLIFAVVVVLFLVLLRIVNSPFGRVLQAIRENDFRAEALGFRTVTYRTVSTVLAALFVARRRRDRPGAFLLRLGIAVIALACLLPTPRADLWRTDLQTPLGITDGTATADIPDDAVVLILPYSFRGNGMYWQALDRMRYRMAGGYSAAAVPAGYVPYPVVYGFYRDELPANPRQELLRYLAFTGTTWVLVDRRSTAWSAGASTRRRSARRSPAPDVPCRKPVTFRRGREPAKRSARVDPRADPRCQGGRARRRSVAAGAVPSGRAPACPGPNPPRRGRRSRTRGGHPAGYRRRNLACRG